MQTCKEDSEVKDANMPLTELKTILEPVVTVGVLLRLMLRSDERASKLEGSACFSDGDRHSVRHNVLGKQTRGIN